MFAVVCSTSVLVAENDSAEVTGWISDRNCGAKGASTSHKECLRQCLRSGDKLVVVTDTDQKLLLVENPDAVKGYEAQHVEVVGRVDSARGIIHVEQIHTLKEK